MLPAVFFLSSFSPSEVIWFLNLQRIFFFKFMCICIHKHKHILRILWKSEITIQCLTLSHSPYVFIVVFVVVFLFMEFLTEHRAHYFCEANYPLSLQDLPVPRPSQPWAYRRLRPGQFWGTLRNRTQILVPMHFTP